MMKTILHLMACIFFASSTLFGQTPVPPGPVSGTWTSGNTPYQIQGDIYIPNGLTLTIEPGVRVEFQDRYSLSVEGRILAVGSEADSILFTAADPLTGWKNLYFLNTDPLNDSSRFEYCIFEYGNPYGDIPFNYGGAIAASGFSKFTIDHCHFRYNKALDGSLDPTPGGGAICLAYGSSPRITNSVFSHNEAYSGGAIAVLIDCNPLIRNNEFRHNTTYSYGQWGQGYGGGINVYLNSHPEISFNTFYDNYGDVGGGAISIVDKCDPVIKKNLIYNNVAFWGAGIEVQDSCSPLIVNNSIVYNHTYSVGGGIDFWGDSCNSSIKNNILWGNKADVEGNQVMIQHAGSFPDFYYNDIEGGQAGIGGVPVSGQYIGNLDDEPVFEDAIQHDYHLLSSSPCVNTGDPAMFDPDLTRCDIGCYYFNHTVVTALEPTAMNYLDSTFAANWEAAPGASGYLLDVAYDENFTDFAAGYHNMDVGNVTSFDVDAGVMDNGYACYYRLRAYYFMGRTGYSNTIGVFAVNIDENENELSIISVYPNPCASAARLQFTVPGSQRTTIDIFERLCSK